VKVAQLRCTGCGAVVPYGLSYHCETCGFPLAVEYEPTTVPLEDPAEAGVWRYHAHLPDVEPSRRITLGEGETPLLELARLGATLGARRVFLKHEGVNPTGSFKDRPTAVGLSVSLELGADTVVVSSTGNAGAALAAYAARAGIRAVVLASAGVSLPKLAPIAAHAAEVVLVNGSVSDAFWLGYRAAREWGWANLTSTFLNPYTTEGNKTVAFELRRQLPVVPDAIVVPVSVGPLLVGIERGYRELQALGLVDRIPRLVAVQAENCAPIVEAFETGRDTVSAWQGPTQTIAGGIADPLAGYENDATYALRVIRESGGFAIACSDQEIEDAAVALARREGVLAEPTGAVSVAGAARALRRGLLEPDELIVCVVTGHGLKQLPSTPAAGTGLPTIEPTLDALDEALRRREVVSI
jgi:threonine synthase